jgi:hypothetical protein
MPTNFLRYAGTSGNSGLLTSLLTLMTTELNSLPNGSVIVSSVGGSSGLFTNANTGQAIWGEVFFFAGNPAILPVAGANLAGWWLTSPDSGTTLEPTTAAPARAPDFIIPLPASTTSTTSTVVSGKSSRILVPALQFKVLIQNNAGLTLSTGSVTAPFLKLAACADQY